MKKFRRFLIGALAVMVVSIPTGVAGVILITIVCTMGISLIVYVPIFIFIGAHIERFVLKGLGRGYEEIGQFSFFPARNRSATDNQTITNNQKALMNNIWELKKRGATNAQIDKELSDLGWTIKEIEEAFELCKKTL